MMLRVAPCVVLTLVCGPVSAQSVTAWPAEAPFEVLEQRDEQARDEHAAVRVLDASGEQCRDHYSALLASGAELAPGLTVVGVAWDVNGGAFLVTLGRAPNELLRLTVREEQGRCVERLALDTWTVRDGDWRVALPPLPIAEGASFDPDERITPGQ